MNEEPTDQTLADAYAVASTAQTVMLWGVRVRFVYEGEFWHQFDPTTCTDRPGCELNHEPDRRQMWSAWWEDAAHRFGGRGETSGEALAYCELMMFREYAPWFAKPK